MKWPKKSTKGVAPVVTKVDDVADDSDSETDSDCLTEDAAGPSDNKPTSLGKKTCQFCALEIPIKAVRCYHCRSDQVIKSAKTVEPNQKVVKFRGFKIYKTDVLDDDNLDAGPVFTEIEFKFTDKNLLMALSRAGLQVYHRGVTDDELKAGWIDGERLVVKLPHLRAMWMNDRSNLVKNLLAEIESVQVNMVRELKALIDQGKMVFQGLWYLIEQGSQIYSFKNGAKVGATVLSADYGFGFDIVGQMVKSDGEHFYYASDNFRIGWFEGVKELKDLDVRLMDPESMDELIERGQIFNELGIGHNFRNYSGYMMSKWSDMFVQKVSADGRVMIDVVTYNRLHPNDSTFRFTQAAYNQMNQRNAQGKKRQYNAAAQQYDHWGGSRGTAGAEMEGKFKSVNCEDLFMCWPTLPGFSFKNKKWGEFLVTLTSPIVFDDKAFDQLVLADEKKVLIKSLVECQENSEVMDRGFTDIISGKGGGCIFLLHGPPGTGKTLTAEAVSEHLHTPLYSVSVGELGTTPHELEKNLQRILEVAWVWKASILMDEADIFLERRTKVDIMRNAMVGIFLRLLEYHNGVLFLTTNRIRAIDDAFSSRISIALHYEELDRDAREAVWRNFLTHVASTDGEDSVSDDLKPHKLSKFKLNGRQIRSTVKLSQSLARTEKVPLSMRHIETTVQVSLSFEEKFEEQVRSKRREKHIYKNRLDKKGKQPASGQSGLRKSIIVKIQDSEEE